MDDDSLHRRTRPTEFDDRAGSIAGREVISAAVLLVLIVVLAYRPSFNAEFVHLDDFQYVVDNELVRQPSLAGVYRVFAEVLHPSTVDGYYQPLTMVSLMVDAKLSGTTSRSVHPFIFHLTNVLLHAATSVLVLVWIRTFLGGLFLPFLVALYFALHPAHVESVAWVSQRKTLLATFLAIAALVAYVECVRHRGRGWLATSVVLYFLATLAKPTTVLLPLVLPLIDLWPLGRRPLAALREKWPFVPVLLIMGYIAWASQAAAGAGVGLPNLSAANAVGRWIGLLSYNTVLYLGNLLWPLHLSPYRGVPDDLSLSNPAILLSVMATAAVVIVWIASWRYSSPLFTGLTAFGLMLAPTMGAIRFMGSCVADRFLYLPMFFLLLPMAYGLFLAGRHFTRPAAFVLPLVLMALPLWILTRAQQGVWQDSKTLWTHVALADPKLAKAHANLALLALEEADYATALDHAERARAYDPENSANLHVLGRAYVRQRQFDKALPLIERALDQGLGPNQAAGLVALGEARICLGDENGALSAAKDAAALGYAVEKAYGEFGDAAYQFARNAALAERMFHRAVDAAPDDPYYRWKRAAALETLGRYAESLRECEEALRLSGEQGREVPDAVRQAVERLRRRAASQPAGGAAHP
ncbi:MAG TPA: tetratricopeptide repeat protein [Phycisphaerae bacterium]|nr:tetratricopeptide repeat protein [Phycisphaerae bacterium]